MRRTRHSTPLLLLPLLALAACGDRGSGLGSDTLARAADFELTVEQTANLIAPVPDLPQDAAVVEALTDFWVDYSLLALVVNQEGALAALDLSPVTRQQLNQELVLLLRDEVIDEDQEISDEELAEIFERDRPGERVRARHILLSTQNDLAGEQVDSLRALAEELRDRARGGEDFGGLAEEYSDDPGSAARGGDLDFFQRGQMVPPFEEAAFALQPGEVSDVVETQFGFHVIRVEDRETPTLDEMGEQLRQELQMERMNRAESIFVAGIEEPADIQMTDDALDRVRSMAESADLELSERERRADLVTFDGGSYTVGEFRWFLLNQPTQLRQQIAGASDDQLDSMLRNLARGELLVQEAERRGITLPEGQREEIESEIREGFRELAQLLGLANISPQEGESLEDAIKRTIDELMPRLVRGEQDVYPLGGLALALREQYRVQISMENMERTADRVGEIRSADPDMEPGAPEMEDPEALLEQLELEEPGGVDPDGEG